MVSCLPKVTIEDHRHGSVPEGKSRDHRAQRRKNFLRENKRFPNEPTKD